EFRRVLFRSYAGSMTLSGSGTTDCCAPARTPLASTAPSRRPGNSRIGCSEVRTWNGGLGTADLAGGLETADWSSGLGTAFKVRQMQIGGGTQGHAPPFPVRSSSPPLKSAG